MSAKTPRNRMAVPETQEAPLHTRVAAVPQEQHQCPACGKWVKFRVVRTVPGRRWTQVVCPGCGRRQAVDFAAAVVRAVAEPAP